MKTLRFKSLSEFVEGTRGMTLDEVRQLATAEYSILDAWIQATPAAQKYHRPPEIEDRLDYYADLKRLFACFEIGLSSATGRKDEMIRGALKQWGQNAKHSSLPDENNS